MLCLPLRTKVGEKKIINKYIPINNDYTTLFIIQICLIFFLLKYSSIA